MRRTHDNLRLATVVTEHGLLGTSAEKGDISRADMHVASGDSAPLDGTNCELAILATQLLAVRVVQVGNERIETDVLRNPLHVGFALVFPGDGKLRAVEIRVIAMALGVAEDRRIKASLDARALASTVSRAP